MYQTQVDDGIPPHYHPLGPRKTPIPSPSSNQCRRGAGIILEVGLDDLLGLVIPRQPVDSALDENQAEFRVLVFSVDFEVFTDGDGFFDEMVKVFGNGGCEACSSGRT